MSTAQELRYPIYDNYGAVIYSIRGMSYYGTVVQCLPSFRIPSFISVSKRSVFHPQFPAWIPVWGPSSFFESGSREGVIFHGIGVCFFMTRFPEYSNGFCGL